MAAKSSDPTPEEIAERAAEIRAGWSEVEEAKRRGADPRAAGWMPAVVAGVVIEAEPEG